MEEQQTKYNIFKIIFLFSALFAAGALLVTAPSYVFGLMPKHKFIYSLLLCIAWFYSYKVGLGILAGKIKFDPSYHPTIHNNVSEQINMDICTGITPPGNRWHNYSSNNPTITNYDPFASVNTGTTYSSTNRNW